MPIVFRCPECRQKLSVSRKKSGQELNCPACKNLIAIPSIEGREAVPVAQAEPELQAATSVADSKSPPLWDDDDDDDDEGFSLKTRADEVEEMDLTPMVDVTFLLLIFFMITASFSVQKTIDVPEPDPDQQGAAQTIQSQQDLEEYSVIVVIDDEDRLFVDEEPLGDVTELEDVLLDKSANEDKNELVIEASPQSSHEIVVKVVDAGNGAKMQKIRLATRREE